MIRDTPGALLFTRLFVLYFRCITPLSILYLSLAVFLHPFKHRLPLALEVYVAAEAAFYLLVYLPRYHFLQRPTTHPPTASREERRELFRKCLATVPDPEQWVSLWNRGAPVQAIRRDNIKEWLAWAFLNKNAWALEDEDELEEYVRGTEALLGLKFKAGRGPTETLRVSLDRVNMSHRPLLYYVCGVAASDLLSSLWMFTHGYQHHTLTRWLTSFPPRPQTVFTPYRSSASHISYWHRPHTSRTHLPILYIHGIGILHTYLSFFADLARASSTSDGQIGIMVLELLPLSFRIAHPALSAAEMTSQIHAILSHHSWSKVVLMANSYGTAIATQLLRSPLTAPLIGPLVLVDPVTFLLHLPDMTHNFTRRKPGRKASEHQLYYFASTDMSAAHTLARRFFWSENILWRDEKCLRGRRMTVVLSGRDIIVDAGTVGRYLTRGRGVTPLDDRGRDEGWKGKEWTGSGMDVLWFEGLNHAEVFDTGGDRGVLVDIAMEYCGGLGVGIEEGGALISRREALILRREGG